MASNNGGERRRRIAERGSDRMALITGRINALPPTPPPPSAHHPARHAPSLSVSSAFDSHSDDTDNDFPSRHLRPHSLSSTAFRHVDYHDENQTGSAEDKQQASISSARLKHQGGFKYTKFDSFENNSEIEEHSDYTSDQVKSEPSSRDSTNTQHPSKPWLQRHTFFSSRELNASIIASENTRALSSLIIALLVVFCYMISDSVLATRPLYIVLVTDITIVLSRLYREKAQETETQGEDDVEAHGWGDAVKIMERGLVAYQAIRGVFIDCSIYLVVVICGISLM